MNSITNRVTSRPEARISSTLSMVSRTSPFNTARSTFENTVWSTAPSTSSTRSYVRTSPAPNEMQRSSNDKASRLEPSACRARYVTASSSACTFSACKSSFSCCFSSSSESRRKSYRWQRESTVTGIFWTSVVARMKITYSGGSSSVFKIALNAPVESMCTSSMI